MKTILTFLSLFGFGAWSLVAQSNDPTAGIIPNAAAPLSGSDSNLFAAMYASIIHNPASLMVIGVLCVFAWLADDLPFINSRYVAHYTVIMGASIYWLFAFPSSVPVNFPHPAAVFASNGIICGLIAFGVHKQAIARILNYFRVKSGTAIYYDKDKPPTQ